MRHTFLALLALFIGCGSTSGTNGNGGANGANGESGPAGNSGHSSLSRVVASDPSVTCRTGGVTVEVGLDSNDDGVLADDEVTSTQDVCNGPLTPPFFVSDIVPPNGGGGATLTASGGRTNPNDGTGASKGQGGAVSLSIVGGSHGGYIKVFDSGYAGGPSGVATWALPAVPTPHLGTSIFPDVTGNETVHAVPSSNTVMTGYLTLTDGEPFGGQLYYRASSGQAPIAVSSLTITESGVLTVEQNDVASVTAFLKVTGDIVNAGYIQPAGAAGATHLSLSCSAYVGLLGSHITTQATRLTITTSGPLHNEGNLKTKGISGDNTPVNGGDILLTSLYDSIYNTGTLLASGDFNSHATTPVGGNGGLVQLVGATGVYNAGEIETEGGGVTATSNATGNGGNITLLVRGQVNNAGTVSRHGGALLRNTADLRSTGATCLFANCQGGNGGNISLENEVGTTTPTPGYIAIANSGRLISLGGNGSRGGKAGDIVVSSHGQQTVGQFGNVSTAGGSIYCSGDIFARGGDGSLSSVGNAATPSTGGAITFTLTPGIGVGQEIVLLGYDNITSDGGDCSQAANLFCGDGGSISMTNTDGGGILNRARLRVRGGGANEDVTTGRGGTITLLAGDGSLPADVPSTELVINHATWSLQGGDALGTAGDINTAFLSSTAGYGGRFTVVGSAGVQNDGAINLSQGRADIASDRPALWSSLMSSGAGAVLSNGPITGTGGSALHASAGTGQIIALIGLTVSVGPAASINLDGGDGLSNTTSDGGGGTLSLTSTEGETFVDPTATLSALAGPHATSSTAGRGEPGVVTIDGVNRFP